MSDFFEDGENRTQGYCGFGHNHMGLREREDEVLTRPHNTQGARGHVAYSEPVPEKVDPDAILRVYKKAHTVTRVREPL